jgi:hypothetical protein
VLSETYFYPHIVYADFQTAIHQAVEVVWPAAAGKGCLFHLCQKWRTKIQNVGLASDYKRNDSEIGQYLHYVVELSFLSPTG